MLIARVSIIGDGVRSVAQFIAAPAEIGERSLVTRIINVIDGFFWVGAQVKQHFGHFWSVILIFQLIALDHQVAEAFEFILMAEKDAAKMRNGFVVPS